MRKSEDFSNAIEKVDLLPAKEIFGQINSIKAIAEEAADETIDVLENIFSEFLKENNLWIEYPISNSNDEYEEILGETFVSNGSEYETWYEDIVLFPIMYSRKTADVTIGHLILHIFSNNEDKMNFSIQLKDSLPKYLKHISKKNLPELKEFSKHSDEEIDGLFFYVDAFNSLQLLEYDITQDIISSEFIEKNHLEYNYDVSRKAGIMIVREWAAIELTKLKYKEQITNDINEYLKNKMDKNLDVFVNVFNSIVITIMTEGGGVGFEYSFENENSRFMIFGDEYGKLCHTIEKLIENKRKFQNDINSIVEKYYDDLDLLNFHYDDILSEGFDLIDNFMNDDEKLSYKINFRMLEECPRDFPETLVIKGDELTKEKLEEIISKIDNYAASRPELSELKFREHCYFYKEDSEDDDSELLN